MKPVIYTVLFLVPSFLWSHESCTSNFPPPDYPIENHVKKNKDELGVYAAIFCASGIYDTLIDTFDLVQRQTQFMYKSTFLNNFK